MGSVLYAYTSLQELKKLLRINDIYLDGTDIIVITDPLQHIGISQNNEVKEVGEESKFLVSGRDILLLFEEKIKYVCR